MFAFSYWFCILVFSQFLFLAPKKKFLVLLANTFQQSHTMQMKEIKGEGEQQEKEKTSRYSKQIKTWNQNFLSHTSPPPHSCVSLFTEIGKILQISKKSSSALPSASMCWKLKVSLQATLYKHSTQEEKIGVIDHLVEIMWNWKSQNPKDFVNVKSNLLFTAFSHWYR